MSTRNKTTQDPIKLAKAVTPWRMMEIASFDGLELHPVQELTDERDGSQYCEQCDPDAAHFWVGVRTSEGRRGVVPRRLRQQGRRQSFRQNAFGYLSELANLRAHGIGRCAARFSASGRTFCAVHGPFAQVLSLLELGKDKEGLLSFSTSRPFFLLSGGYPGRFSGNEIKVVLFALLCAVTGIHESTGSKRSTYRV